EASPVAGKSVPGQASPNSENIAAAAPPAVGLGGAGEATGEGAFGGLGGGVTRAVPSRAAQRDDRSRAKELRKLLNPAISPVILTALRRPVELKSDPTTVQEVALELTTLYDFAVVVDPSVPSTNITLERKSGPMWEVLQSAARPAKLRVVPGEN